MTCAITASKTTSSVACKPYDDGGVVVHNNMDGRGNPKQARDCPDSELFHRDFKITYFA